MSGPVLPDDERPATAGGTEPDDVPLPDEERPVPDDPALRDEPGAVPDDERPVPEDEDLET
jgi:hypothetical protein